MNSPFFSCLSFCCSCGSFPSALSTYLLSVLMFWLPRSPMLLGNPAPLMMNVGTLVTSYSLKSSSPGMPLIIVFSSMSSLSLASCSACAFAAGQCGHVGLVNR